MNNFLTNIIEKDIKNKKNFFLKTRFPPEPNGYLHIGHLKSIFLNFGLAKKYNGLCNLRFDDTNPKKEKTKYVKSIKKDIRWLGFNWNKRSKFTSQYFKEIYIYAKKLIKKNLAYVDLLNKQEIKIYRGTLLLKGKNSPYRNQNIEKNLILFKKMKSGYFAEGQACLRAKIDMGSSFMILRDPVLYRIIFEKHHNTKNNWCIYPTYDFSHCISDSIEKITHSLCTLEFQDNRRIYDWILKNIQIENPSKQYEYSRLKLENTILSKRKLKLLIQKKIVQNWDDPRLATISGLRKRGYTPDSLNNFCNKIGISKQESLIELSLLESCIRKDLNEKSIRRMAVLNPIKLIILNLSKYHYEEIIVPNHPNNTNQGFHKIIFSKEIYIDQSDFQETNNKKYKRLNFKNNVRLRHAYTITVKYVKKNKFGKINKIFCTYDKNTLNKKPKNKKITGVLHWISKINTSKAEFRIYSSLFLIKNPEKEKNFLNFINKNSLTKKIGFVEKDLQYNLCKIPYQFEREGYFFISSLKKYKNKLVFHQTVSLKEDKKLI